MCYGFLFKCLNKKYINYIEKNHYNTNKKFLNYCYISKKKFYFRVKCTDKPFFFFLWKIDISSIFKILNFGLKFKPKLTRKINMYDIFKSREKFLLTLFPQIIVNQISQEKKLNISQLIKFFNINLNIKKKVFKCLINPIDKEFEIIFEETADEIKFILNIEFIRLSLAQNPFLGRCWVAFKSSLLETINFWKSYITSCYNLMTNSKKIFDLKRHKKDFSICSDESVYQMLDFNFYDIKQIRKISFIEKIKDASYFFESDQSFFNINKTINCTGTSISNWRQRHMKTSLIIKNKFNSAKNIFKLSNFILLAD